MNGCMGAIRTSSSPTLGRLARTHRADRTPLYDGRRASRTLSLLTSVAQLAGVGVPVARAMMSVGAAICADDFEKEGRPLSKVGFPSLDRAAITQFLQNGYDA